MTIRFVLHAGSIGDISWCASQGFAEVGLVVTYGSNPSPAFIHNAGIKTATLNPFNDGSAGPGTAGSPYAGYFQSVKSNGWDMVAGEGVGGDVIKTCMNYLPYANYAGCCGNDGGQIDAYADPWNHPTSGTYGHCDYIETYVGSGSTPSQASTIARIKDAKSKGAMHSGPLIGMWSGCLSFGAQFFIDIIDQSGADSVCFWGGYSLDGVSALQSSAASIYQALKSHYGSTGTAAIGSGGGTSSSGSGGIYTDPKVTVSIALKSPAPNMAGRTDAAENIAPGTKVTISGTCTTLHQLSLWRIHANAAGTNIWDLVKNFWPDDGGGIGTFSISDVWDGNGLATYRVGVNTVEGDVTTTTATDTVTAAEADAPVTTSDTTSGTVTPPVGTPITAGTHAAAVLSDGVNIIDVFGCNGTQPSALTHIAYNNGAWDSWAVLGGSFIYSPSAISRSSGNVSVYVVGSDSAVWQTTHAVGYASWTSLGGTTNHGVEACSMASNREDIFVSGTSDGNVYQKYWTSTAGWSGWINQGSPNSQPVNSGPGCCSYAANKLAIFVQGNDKKTWWKNWNGTSWSAWASLGGPDVESTNHPSACGYNGKIYCFVTDSNDHIAYTIFDGTSWSSWVTVLDVIMTCSPEVQMSGDGTTLHYFARGNDKAVWHRTMDTSSGAWSVWETIGGSMP